MPQEERIADPRLVNPVSCAFLGDSVYELLVREEILSRHTSLPPGKLHNYAVQMVRASAQARAFHVVEPMLTGEELAAYKRGRNASAVTPPKHTDAMVYRTATGFEALLGDLYLRGKKDRIRELFRAILDAADEQTEEKAQGVSHVE